MKKFKKFMKQPHGFACLFAVIAILCSFFGSIVNTSGFKVRVVKETIDMTEFYEEHPTYDNVSMPYGEDVYDAKLTGNWYIPKGVDAEHPAPCVVLTHGYLNSKEFEEAPAIEMSRRGYVVFAFDQYDHGESTWDTSKAGAFAFFAHSVYDAVQVAYSKDFVLKGSDGVGMISVSGHSMGGFSSEVATALDGLNVVGSLGEISQKICACLAVGADFMYLNLFHLTDPFLAVAGSRTVGTIAGVYDEFFFDTASEATTETVREKHYTQDPQGIALLGRTEAGESHTWYLNGEENAEDGNRIIYEVSGDHPYNTWSPEATKCMIEFYDHAFKQQAELHGADLSLTTVHEEKGQTWWLKEVFTCIGMIALVGMMLCLALTLVKLPFFKDVVTPAKEISKTKPVGLIRKIVGIVVSVASLALSVIYIPAFMDMSEKLAEVDVIGTVFLIIGLVFAALSLVYQVVAKLLKKSHAFFDEFTADGIFGGLVIATVALALKWFVGDGKEFVGLLSGNGWLNADSITSVVYWAMGAGILSLLFTLVSHFIVKGGRDASNLGLKATVKQVLKALFTAVVVCAAGWLVLFLCDTIFGVDFRVYIYAFRPVTKQAFDQAIRYIPLFFIFYLCSGITVANTADGLDGWKADLKCAAIQVLPVIIFMIIQYSTQMIGGVGAWPAFALNVIVVQNLVWTLVFLSIIQRRTLKATGNIWTGVFINTIWFTMITLASTCIYLF